LRCLGWALFHAGEKKEGIVALQRSLFLDGENEMTLCDLGVCFLQIGKVEKAREFFEKAGEIDPNSPRVTQCLEILADFEKEDNREKLI